LNPHKSVRMTSNISSLRARPIGSLCGRGHRPHDTPHV
jgi:hypothetical protein